MAALVAVPGLALLPMAPAHAALNSPTAGSTQSGVVSVREANGASNNCVAGQGSPYTRFQVTRADGTVVGSDQQSGTGAKTYAWSSVGQPRGAYVARSWTRSAEKSGFLNLGCSNRSEVAQPTVSFTVDNHAAVALSLPATTVTGEDLTVGVQTSIVGSGVTGQPLGGREVTLTLPGVEDVEPVVVATDGTGAGTATIDLPDLATGELTVAAEVTTDDLYTGDATTATTQLTARATHVFYRGHTRGQPGTDAQLVGRLVDVTADSDRYGERVPGRTVVLALGDDAAPAVTDDDGDARRQAPVTGASRVTSVSATFPGDDVYAGSSETLKFYVGDAAAEPAPVVATPVQGNATGLVGWLGGLLGPVVTIIETIVSPVENAVGVPAVSGLLEALVPTLQDGAGTLGAGIDEALATIDREVLSRTPLGDLSSTAQYTWRAVSIGEGGVVRREEFGAVIGVPQLLDVTGDGTADLIANIRFSGVGLSSTDGFSATPRLEIVRIGDVSQQLPLSLQAVLDLAGGEEEYRFGYDTRDSNAPRDFAADLVLADGGVTLQVASSGEDALDVTGAIVPAAADGQPATTPTEPADLEAPLPAPPAPAEQRFAISFDSAPSQAAIGLDLGSDSRLAARFSTDRPTAVGLSMTDDSGADRVFLADGLIDDVDGEVGILVDGDTDSGLTAEVTSPTGLEQLSLRAVELDAGRTASDVRLALTDVPDTVSFALDAAGAGALTASGAIGVFEAGYASGRELALLDDPAYLRLDQLGDASSVALRLPGFEGLSLDLTDDLAIGLTTAPTPLRALADLDGLELDARVLDAPHRLDLALGRDGAVRIAGSDPISEVLVDAHDDAGIFDGSTDLSLRLVDVPSLLEVGVSDGGVSFGTGGEPIGLLEVFADSGTPVDLPADADGLVLRSSPTGTQVAGRVTGLRTISASLDGLPEVLLDTVAGKVFGIEVVETDAGGAETGRLTASIDHLVPNVRLGLVDDGSGATRLRYSADEPTNALTFDLGDLSGSISNPLPRALEVCQAGDEACLPEVGLADPTLGSVRLWADETTTLDIVDPSGSMNVNGLRLRVLDLTGSIDGDTGGPLYLNTTEYGEGCETGCARPIEGGSITSELDSVKLTFEPGNGFNADRALTNLKVDKILGVPVGLSGQSGTGAITCVPATKIQVRVLDLLNVSIKDALCNVPRTN
ncbi:hypothetical protein GCM10009812_25770 [Nocardioides marinus]